MAEISPPKTNSANFFRMESAELSSSPSVGEACLTAKEALEQAGPVRLFLRKNGNKWTDFLSTIASGSPLLCSERVVEAIAAAKLTGYKVVSVKLFPRLGPAIKPPWPYYWIVPTGAWYRCRAKYYLGCQDDHRYVFVDESPDEPRGRSSGSSTDSIYFKRIPRPETWDGNDFNYYTPTSPVGVYGITLCSRRVVDLAARNKWTNVIFQPVDAVDNYAPNHLKEPWPPASFYSEFEPE
jgi:hypothetical protein